MKLAFRDKMQVQCRVGRDDTLNSVKLIFNWEKKWVSNT